MSASTYVLPVRVQTDRCRDRGIGRRRGACPACGGPLQRMGANFRPEPAMVCPACEWHCWLGGPERRHVGQGESAIVQAENPEGNPVDEP